MRKLLSPISFSVKDSLFTNITIVLFVLLSVHPAARAQQVEYSTPLGDNIRSTSFDIVGRCKNHLLIYKKSYGDYIMALYDERLKIIDQVPMKFLPPEITQEDFINLSNKVFMVYQYRHKRDIYCKAVMLDQDARPLAGPLLIDKTEHPGEIVGDNAYITVHSEDKNRIMVLEVLKKEDSLLYSIRTFLYDSSMQLLRRGSVTLPYGHEGDRPEAFCLSDKGGLYFILGNSAYDGDPYYQRVSVYYKAPYSRTLLSGSLPLEGHLPNTSLLLKIDNPHQSLRVSALQYDSKRRDIDRLSILNFGLDSLRLLQGTTVMLTDSLKTIMQGKNEGLRQTFNDYVLSDMVVDRAGNALLIAEEKFMEAGGATHRDNLALFELDPKGDLLQLLKIKKQQGDDLAATFASYLLVNTGGALHLLMNKSHRIFRFLNNYLYLLADYRYSASHQLKEMPVMRGLDNKKRWAPRYGMQVSRNEVVIPCVMGSLLLFGKISY